MWGVDDPDTPILFPENSNTISIVNYLNPLSQSLGVEIIYIAEMFGFSKSDIDKALKACMIWRKLNAPKK